MTDEATTSSREDVVEEEQATVGAAARQALERSGGLVGIAVAAVCAVVAALAGRPEPSSSSPRCSPRCGCCSSSARCSSAGR